MNTAAVLTLELEHNLGSVESLRRLTARLDALREALEQPRAAWTPAELRRVSRTLGVLQMVVVRLRGPVCARIESLQRVISDAL